MSAYEMGKSFDKIADLIRKESDANMAEVRKEQFWREITDGSGREYTRGPFREAGDRIVDSCPETVRHGNAHGAATPMATEIKLDEAEKLGAREVDPAEYQAIVGSLMYLALAARPDISFAVSALSRYNSCLRMMHLTAAKRLLRHLKMTANHCLCFRAKDDKDGDGDGDSDGGGDDDAIANEIIGYTHSDWASGGLKMNV